MSSSPTQTSPAHGVAPARLSDRALAARVARDQSAFAEVVRRYGEPLRRHAAGFVGEADAEDVVQQAFISASLALKRDPDREIELRPWLYRVTTNAAIDHQRGRAARPPVDRSDDERGIDERVGASADPYDVIAEREAIRSLTTRMGALAPNQRRAATARFLEGRSHDEIAAQLGVTAGAARELIHRARRNLRDAMPALSPVPLFVRFKEALSGAFAGSASVPAAKLALGAGIVAIAAGGGAVILGATGESPDTARVGDGSVAPAAAVSAPPSLGDPASAGERRNDAAGTGNGVGSTGTPSSSSQAGREQGGAADMPASSGSAASDAASPAGERTLADSVDNLTDQLGIGETIDGLGLTDPTSEVELPDLSDGLGVEAPKLPKVADGLAE